MDKIGTGKLYSDSKYHTNLKLIEKLLGNRVTDDTELGNLAKKLFGSRFKGGI